VNQAQRNDDARRAHRVHFSRDVTEHKYEDNAVLYGSHGHDSSLDWNVLRKRNGEGMNDNNRHRMNGYPNKPSAGGQGHKRDHKNESEPEWFSGESFWTFFKTDFINKTTVVSVKFNYVR